MYKVLVVFFGLLVSGCFEPEPQYKPLPKETIEVIVSEDVISCQVEGIMQTVELYSDLWDISAEDYFEVKIMSKNKVDELVEDFRNIKYINDVKRFRRILITFAKNPGPFTQSECENEGKCYYGWGWSTSFPESQKYGTYWVGNIELKTDNCHKRTIVHEFGHVFSLDHVDESCNFMKSGSGCPYEKSFLLESQAVQSGNFALNLGL